MYPHIRTCTEWIQIYSGLNHFVVFPFKSSTVSISTESSHVSHSVISETQCHLQFCYIMFWNFQAFFGVVFFMLASNPSEKKCSQGIQNSN